MPSVQRSVRLYSFRPPHNRHKDNHVPYRSSHGPPGQFTQVEPANGRMVVPLAVIGLGVVILFLQLKLAAEEER